MKAKDVEAVSMREKLRETFDWKFVNVLMLSMGSLLLFTAFQTTAIIKKTVLASIQAEDPEFKADGYTNLAILYGVYACCNWFAPSIISVLTPKWTIFLACIPYIIFMSSFLKPNTTLMYVVSALLGFGSSLYWTSQGNILTLCSDKTTIVRNSGILVAMLQASLLFGNLFVFFEFEGQTIIAAATRVKVFTCLIGAAVAAMVVFVHLKPVRDRGASAVLNRGISVAAVAATAADNKAAAAAAAVEVEVVGDSTTTATAETTSTGGDRRTSVVSVSEGGPAAASGKKLSVSFGDGVPVVGDRDGVANPAYEDDGEQAPAYDRLNSTSSTANMIPVSGGGDGKIVPGLVLSGDCKINMSSNGATPASDKTKQSSPGVAVRKNNRRGPKEALAASVKLFLTREMAMLSIMFVWTGLAMSFFTGVYSASIGFTAQLGPDRTRFIGVSGMLLGAGGMIGGTLIGLIGKNVTNVRRCVIVCTGTVIMVLTYAVVFVNIPGSAVFGHTDESAYMQSNLWLAVMCSFFMGLGYSCFNTQIYSLLGTIYSVDSAPAFALYKFVQSLAAAAAFFYTSHLNLYAQLITLAVLCCLGTTAFCSVVIKRKNDL